MGEAAGAPPARAAVWLRAAGDVGVALLRCWPIVVVPLLAAGIAFGTAQGGDAFAAVAGDTKGFAAYAAQALGTLLATGLAMAILAPRAAARPSERFAAYFIPGLLGLLAGLLPVLPFSESPGAAGSDGQLGYLVLSTLMTAAGVVLMREALPRNGPWPTPVVIATMLLGLAFAAVFILVRDIAFVAGFTVIAFGVADLFLWRHAQPPAGPGWARAGIPRGAVVLIPAVLAIPCGLALAADPARWGLLLGSYATLLLALDAWLAVCAVALLVVRGLDHRLAARPRLRRATVAAAGLLLALALGRPDLPLRAPAIALAAGGLLLAAAFAGPVRGLFAAASLLGLLATGPFDLIAVRELPAAETPADTTTLEQQALRFLSERAAEIRATERYPVFVVNADGGGIRAAYWSAALLGALQDRAPDFARHVFALSGVSGGSLGLAVFAAMAAEPASPGGGACAGLGWQGCASLVLGQDLLAPPLAAMLTGDLARAVLRGAATPDRAVALEQAFERAWRAATDGERFAEPATALRGTAAPMLLLNATEARSGQRLVFGLGGGRPSGSDAIDLEAMLAGRRLRLATAVLLSARFPGLSPAGLLCGAAPGGEGCAAVVDGGYADNSGAITAGEAIAALRAAAAQLDLPQVSPIALMIANDAQPALLAPAPLAEPIGGFAATTLGSLVSPALTLEALRQAGSRRAKAEYRQRVVGWGGEVLDRFDLRPDTVAFPLGWMLADATRRAMDAQVAAMGCEAGSDFNRALSLLGALPPACAAAIAR